MARRGRLEAQRDEAEEVAFDEELNAAASAESGVQELVDGQRNLFDARRVSVAARAEQLGNAGRRSMRKYAGSMRRKRRLPGQLELIEEELGNQQTLLDRGLTQASAVLNLQREQARLAGRSANSAAHKAQSQERVTEIDIERLKLRSAGREEAITQLRDLRYRELEIAEQRRALKGEIDRLDIRAPVSGVIYAHAESRPRDRSCARRSR